MRRLNVNVVDQEKQTNDRSLDDTLILGRLIEDYGPKNDTMKALKKELSEKATRIKELMKTLSKTSEVWGNYKAEITERNTSKLDEDMLLDVLKRHKELSYTLDLIKIKEYVDMDALESAMYKNEIPEEILEELGKCKTTMTTEVLNVKRLKGGK